MNSQLVEIASFGRGGIHPPTHKDLTAHRAIGDLPWPGEVWLPLIQHLGEPAVPIVKKGDAVARGQKIAEGGATGAPIHASVPGKIKFIDKRPHPTLVTCPTLVIRHIDETEELPFEEDPAWRSLDHAETLGRIREAGIVGLGGAAFPTHRKLVLPKGVEVDTFILNGAE
jgi:electron transport complex protein RnfC